MDLFLSKPRTDVRGFVVLRVAVVRREQFGDREVEGRGGELLGGERKGVSTLS